MQFFLVFGIAKWAYLFASLNVISGMGLSAGSGGEAGVTSVEQFPVISSRENIWKLFHSFDVIPCNITNYFIRCQSER